MEISIALWAWEGQKDYKFFLCALSVIIIIRTGRFAVCHFFTYCIFVFISFSALLLLLLLSVL